MGLTKTYTRGFGLEVFRRKKLKFERLGDCASIQLQLVSSGPLRKGQSANISASEAIMDQTRASWTKARRASVLVMGYTQRIRG